MKARCNLKTRPVYPKQAAACHIRRTPLFEQNKRPPVRPPVITGARVFQIKENKVNNIKVEFVTSSDQMQ